VSNGEQEKSGHPWWPLLPFAVAAGAGVVVGLDAPSLTTGQPVPTWFESFFATSAAVIATLFVALALGSRQIEVKPLLAWLTMLYIGLGEVAAVAGLSTGLPYGWYPVLLGITAGTGIGALLSSVIIGGAAISVDESKRRKEVLEDIYGGPLPNPTPKRAAPTAAVKPAGPQNRGTKR
jgi:hypothetical protein